MVRICSLTLILTLLAGCDAKVARFQPNAVHALTVAHAADVGTQSASHDVTQVVDGLFGSPSEPRWPTHLLGEAGHLVDVDNLARAAGLVSSNKQNEHRGLYLEHCATCHSLEGSGAGPASLIQNPYPRDFRPGIFKWKSTERAARPTRDDLLRTLHDGVPGTGMPSFAKIAEADREALVDYVIFLSVRGEVERLLLNQSVYELGYEDGEDQDDEYRLTYPMVDESEAAALVTAIIRKVATKWQAAEQEVVSIPTQETAFDDASAQRGKDLFHGQIANCAGCHGPQGNGQAITMDYDDWAKEYSTRLGLTPSDREKMKPFRAAGAPRPRQIQPRNLQDGVFRGGSDSATLFRRISQGIAGTPMPGIEITDQPSPKGLTSDQVWDLVHYIQSLGTDDSLQASAQQEQRP